MKNKLITSFLSVSLLSIGITAARRGHERDDHTTDRRNSAPRKYAQTPVVRTLENVSNDLARDVNRLGKIKVEAIKAFPEKDREKVQRMHDLIIQLDNATNEYNRTLNETEQAKKEAINITKELNKLTLSLGENNKDKINHFQQSVHNYRSTLTKLEAVKNAVRAVEEE